MPPIKVEERWLPVVHPPGYEVSNKGRVRSYWKRTGKDHETVFFISKQVQKVLKPRVINKCYLVVGLKTGYKTTRSFGVGHLVLSAFVRPPLEGEVCRHYHDKTPTNCSLYNLRWGTQAENIQDQIRHNGGVCHHKGKVLSAETREKIRQGHLGKSLSDEHKAKIALTKMGNTCRHDWCEEQKRHKAEQVEG